jgi:peptidoglycan/LPS O-acetylase OafA/YrhL
MASQGSRGGGESEGAPAGQPRERANFLGDIHAFRGIAISYVVAAHAVSAFSWNGEGGDTYHRALMILFQNSTVLFVFIAGYLFHHLSGRFEYKTYLRTKARNVILPYLILSVPAIVYFTSFAERGSEVRADFYQSPIWAQVMEFYLTGAHLAPYWFIPMIGLYYLCAPAFLALSRAKWGLWTLIPLLVISCLIPRGAIPSAFVHFFSVYLAGIMASRYREATTQFLRQNWVKVLSGLLVLVLAILELTRNNGTMTYLNFLQKMLLCGLLMGILHVSWQQMPGWVAQVADTSFGIYFLHSYVISSYKLLYTSYVGELPPGSFLGVAVTAAIALAVSHCLVRGAQHLLGARSRMLVGA